MSYDKLLRVIDSLHDNTNSKKISWENTADETIFQTSFSKASVRIQEYGSSYYIYIYNSDGVEAESSSSDFLTREGYPGHAHKLKSIYQLARRSALGVEKVLDELLDDLGEIPF